MVDDICWHVVHAIHSALDYLAITAYICQSKLVITVVWAKSRLTSCKMVSR
jgi:hypothetical protein